MSDPVAATGSCLCQSVKVTAKAISTNIGACHCSMCQKWSGGPLLAIDCGNDVSFENADNIAAFSSSEWAERGFCSSCGTHLYYRLKQNNQYIMPVGLFDQAADFKFDHQIFIDEKPSYYCFANETKNMTGEEVFAQFSSSAE